MQDKLQAPMTLHKTSRDEKWMDGWIKLYGLCIN